MMDKNMMKFKATIFEDKIKLLEDKLKERKKMYKFMITIGGVGILFVMISSFISNKFTALDGFSMSLLVCSTYATLRDYINVVPDIQGEIKCCEIELKTLNILLKEDGE